MLATHLCAEIVDFVAAVICSTKQFAYGMHAKQSKLARGFMLEFARQRLKLSLLLFALLTMHMHCCNLLKLLVFIAICAHSYAFVSHQILRTTRSVRRGAAAAASGDADGEAETRVVHILPARVADVKCDPSTPLVDLRANDSCEDADVLTSTQQQVSAPSGKTTVVSLRVPAKHQSRYSMQLSEILLKPV
jgi:hypothetical protein